MAPGPDGVTTGLTLDLVFVDACKAAAGGSDRCWPTVQSWRNACCGACCSAIRGWCCWLYEMIEWLNRPEGLLETNDCAFRGLEKHQDLLFSKSIRATGRVQFFVRSIEIKAHSIHIKWL